MTMHSGHEYGRVTIVAQWNEIIFELVFQWFIGSLSGVYWEIIGCLSGAYQLFFVNLLGVYHELIALVNREFVWSLSGVLPTSLPAVFIQIKAPLYTKLPLMDCGISKTNLLGSSSSGLEYGCFYMKSTDGATMYLNLGIGIGRGRIQTDY